MINKVCETITMYEFSCDICRRVTVRVPEENKDKAMRYMEEQLDWDICDKTDKNEPMQFGKTTVCPQCTETKGEKIDDVVQDIRSCMESMEERMERIEEMTKARWSRSRNPKTF